jgi:SSS family solute:Na+ symporter
MVLGTWMAATLGFKGSVYPLHLGGTTIAGYAALWALLVNLAVAAVVTSALRAFGAPAGADHTSREDYGE